MPHIRVVTDSACDIPDALLDQYDITVLPHSMQLDGETYSDQQGHKTAHLLTRLRSEPAPVVEVAPPLVEEFSRVYRSMRETCDGVISIHASARLSDALANAQMAREAYGLTGQGGPFPIAVADSLSMSMGLGWVVLATARAARAGLDLQKLASSVTRLAGLSHVAFYTEYLDSLVSSGRAPRLASQLGSLSALKPLLHLDEGQISVYERTRTRAKARDALYNFVEDFPQIGEIAVLHTGAESDVDHLLTRIGAIYPRERVVVLQPGLAVSAWLGPDAVGVAVLEGEE